MLPRCWNNRAKGKGEGVWGMHLQCSNALFRNAWFPFSQLGLINDPQILNAVGFPFGMALRCSVLHKHARCI